MEEGLNSTDAFLTLTGKDELNILMSFYARSKNVPKLVTKVNINEYASLAEQLGLNCIMTPRKIVADAIVKYARALESSLGSQIETLYSLMNGKAEAAEFKILPDFKHTGVPLKMLKIKKDYIVAGIIRKRKAVIPGGDDMILADDHVIVIAAGKTLHSLSDIFED